MTEVHQVCCVVLYHARRWTRLRVRPRIWGEVLEANIAAMSITHPPTPIFSTRRQGSSITRPGPGLCCALINLINNLHPYNYTLVFAFIWTRHDGLFLNWEMRLCVYTHTHTRARTSRRAISSGRGSGVSVFGRRSASSSCVAPHSRNCVRITYRASEIDLLRCQISLFYVQG